MPTDQNRPVYATAQGYRLGAQIDNADPSMVAVWLTNGSTIGQYRLDRFRDSRLTPATLRELFEPADTPTP